MCCEKLALSRPLRRVANSLVVLMFNHTLKETYETVEACKKSLTPPFSWKNEITLIEISYGMVHKTHRELMCNGMLCTLQHYNDSSDRGATCALLPHL